MAAGSHAEKGIWALLVIAATIIKRGTSKPKLEAEEKDQITKLKSPSIVNQAIETKIQTSPTRFDKTVIMPALLDFLEG